MLLQYTLVIVSYSINKWQIRLPHYHSLAKLFLACKRTRWLFARIITVGQLFLASSLRYRPPLPPHIPCLQRYTYLPSIALQPLKAHKNRKITKSKISKSNKHRNKNIKRKEFSSQSVKWCIANVGRVLK